MPSSLRSPPAGAPADAVLLRTSQQQRRACFERDAGKCCDCGRDYLPWEAEHDLPLWLVNRDDPNAWKYWTVWNLRTRCIYCHKVKSAVETSMRAKGKRLKEKFILVKRGPKTKKPQWKPRPPKQV